MGTALGMLGLVGWLTDARVLMSIVPTWPRMVPTSAVALIALGIASALRWREDVSPLRKAVAAILAGATCAFGLTALVMGPLPVCPTPMTASAFAFLAAAVSMFDVRAMKRAVGWLVLAGALAASVTLIALLFGAGPHFAPFHAPIVGVALPTALALICISVGLMLERPATGLAAVIRATGPGGVMLRRLLAPSILAPVLLGLLVMHASRASGFHDLPLVVAAHASAMILVSVVLLATIAERLNRTHAALEESHIHVQSLFDQASESIFVTNALGVYTDVNEAGCELLGRTRDEIIGKRIDDFVSPEDVPRLELARMHLRQGATSLAPWRLRHADGHYIPVEISARSLPDGRTQGFLRDITERVRTENEERLFADVGAVLGSMLANVEMLPKVARLVVRDVADGCVIELREENGTRRRIDARGSGAPHDLAYVDFPRRIEVPLIAHGAPVGTLTFLATSGSRAFDDDDERVAQELAHRVALAVENARLYAAAQRAVEARNDVLGVVVHDLKNPLGVILMQAGLLRGQDEAAAVIERTAKRMNRRIRDLLDITRMEAGRFTLDQARVRTDEFIREIIATQGPLVASGKLSLRAEVARDLPVVSTDRQRLMQVFENLIGNAVKFSDGEAAITIGATPRDGDVLFWVKDTGRGISREEQAHVFDRFWQAQEKARQGAGLGLPLVKGIVDAHGGKIWIESEPGRGTTFFFTLPAQASA